MAGTARLFAAVTAIKADTRSSTARIFLKKSDGCTHGRVASFFKKFRKTQLAARNAATIQLSCASNSQKLNLDPEVSLEVFRPARKVLQMVSLRKRLCWMSELTHLGCKAFTRPIQMVGQSTTDKMIMRRK